MNDYEKLTNRELLDIYLKNNLIRRCIDCQFAKMKDKQFKEDLYQDTIVWFLTYDNEKLNNAHMNNHMNALLTRYIQNNIYSSTSPYYTTYNKFMDRSNDITPLIEDTVPYTPDKYSNPYEG